MKRPTQKDIARLAGVSRATVSYVLNDTAQNHFPISEETRKRILTAADDLGYVPEAAALSLRLRSSRTIGLLVPDLVNPHYWQLIRGVEETLNDLGYSLLLNSVSLNPQKERSALHSLLSRKVDGLILILSYPLEETLQLAHVRRRHSPVVILGFNDPQMDGVGQDDEIGTRHLMTHLLGLGHREIGFIYGVAHPGLGDIRVSEYRHQLALAGIPVREDLVVNTGPSIEEGYQAACQLLDRPTRPSALISVNDRLALGVLRACHERGLRIPSDISVASFDDIDEAAYFSPTLTTVHTNALEMGKTAAELILARIQNPDKAVEHRLLANHLVVRSSTGPVPYPQHQKEVISGTLTAANEPL